MHVSSFHPGVVSVSSGSQPKSRTTAASSKGNSRQGKGPLGERLLSKALRLKPLRSKQAPTLSSARLKAKQWCWGQIARLCLLQLGCATAQPARAPLASLKRSPLNARRSPLDAQRSTYLVRNAVRELQCRPTRRHHPCPRTRFVPPGHRSRAWRRAQTVRACRRA